MKLCPPKPGTTVITSIKSISSIILSKTLISVDGFNDIPTLQPRDLIISMVTLGLSSASGWNVIISDPDLAKSSNKGFTGVIIKWTSNGILVHFLISLITSGPIVKFGT